MVRLSESQVVRMQLQIKTLTTTGGGGGGREGGGSLITCKTGLIKNCRLHRQDTIRSAGTDHRAAKRPEPPE